MSRDRYPRPNWYDEDEPVARPGPRRTAPGKVSLTSRIGRFAIQRSPASPGKAALTDGLPPTAGLAVQRAQQSPGQPLPEDLRGRLEPSLGEDLRSVRVHTGSESAAAAQAVRAQAYTVGRDIHFDSGQYAPGGQAGQWLIAHEATHVAQQRAGVQLRGAVGRPGDVYEQEADRAADAVLRGELADVSDSHKHGTASAAIQFFGRAHQEIGDAAASEDQLGANDGRVVLAQADRARTTVNRWACVDVGPGTRCENEPENRTWHPDDYRLTPGEVAFAADYFSSFAEMQAKAREYLENGQARTSKDEIWYVVQVRLYEKTDMQFDSATVAAVSARYMKLASTNYAHFSRPSEGRSQIFSNGATYRENHENAIRMAVQAGAANRPGGEPRGGEGSLDEALALEAFGSHFLQDMFPAGHIRTPRLDAEKLWDAKYPTFWGQLKSWLREQLWNAGGKDVVKSGSWQKGGWIARSYVGVKSARDVFDEQFADAMKGIPPFSLGTIVGCAMHDYDNKMGVWAESPLGPDGQQPFQFRASGEGGTLDSTRGKDEDATRRLAIEATRAGRADIMTAFTAGRAGERAETVLSDLQLSGPAADGTTYQAERYRPVAIDQSADPRGTNTYIDWKNADLNSLQYDTELGIAVADSIRHTILGSLQDVAGAQKELASLFAPVIAKLQGTPLETLKEIATSGLVAIVISESVGPTDSEASGDEDNHTRETE